jgi:hypothetical protein
VCRIATAVLAATALTVPASGAHARAPYPTPTFAACPFTGANAFSPAVQAQLLAYSGDNDVPHWIRHPHASRPGYEPLEIYEP